MKIVFRLVDTTGRKLDKLLSEPFKTGLRVGCDALELVPQTDEDRELRTSNLRFALEKLETAYTHTEARDANGRFYIRFFQGLLSAGMRSPAYTKKYLSDCISVLKKRVEHLRHEKETLDRRATQLIKEATNNEYLLRTSPGSYSDGSGMFLRRAGRGPDEWASVREQVIYDQKKTFLEPPHSLRWQAARAEEQAAEHGAQADMLIQSIELSEAAGTYANGGL
jgi:hypothetical protein